MDDGIEDSAGIGDGNAGEGRAERASGGDAPRDEVEDGAIAELERLLVAQGPLTVEELAAALAAQAPQLASDLVASEEADLVTRVATLTGQAGGFWRIADGRLAPVLHFLRRATFTHRLTAGELDREAVDLSPDLVALALPRSFSLPDGTTVRTAGSSNDGRAAEEGSLLGPPAWLAPFAAGDLLAVRYDGEQVQLEQLPDAALDEPAGRAIGEALRLTFATLRGELAPEVHRLVVDTMGTHPASFAVPVAPVAELLGSVGIRVREAWVGPADSPWQSPPERARRRRLEELLAGAEACCQNAARHALTAWHTWLAERGDAGDPVASTGDVARLATDIDHGPVAALLAETATLGRPIVTVARLGEWAAAVASAAGTATAGVEYLQALGADSAGDASGAEAHLKAGLEIAPDHPACLGFLAELASDRGDAPRSLTLLRQARRPPGPEELRELEPFLANNKVGRNDPCPCGSGRKFKTCCSGRAIQQPLAERCRWLLAKATRHTVRTDPLAVQSLRHLFDAWNDGGEAMALTQDMLLFATPGLARYLDARHDLLPADELACARSWAGRPLRLLEVEATAPAGLIEVVDLRTGERLSVADQSAAATLSEGDAVLARPLPVGEISLLTSVRLQIPPSSRDQALEMLQDEVRPFQLLQLLVDLQVNAIRGWPAETVVPPGSAGE